MSKYLSSQVLTIAFLLTLTYMVDLVLACDCNAAGSYSNICDARTGQCHCKPSFKGRNCDQCKQSGLVFPDCEGDVKCKCHKDGTLLDRKRKGPCIEEVSR